MTISPIETGEYLGIDTEDLYDGELDVHYMGDSTTEMEVEGRLNWVEWKGFSSNSDEQKGNYLPMHFKPDTPGAVGTCEITPGSGKIVPIPNEGEDVYFRVKSNDQKIVVKYYNSGTAEGDPTYTVNISLADLKLTADPSVKA